MNSSENSFHSTPCRVMTQTLLVSLKGTTTVCLCCFSAPSKWLLDICYPSFYAGMALPLLSFFMFKTYFLKCFINDYWHKQKHPDEKALQQKTRHLLRQSFQVIFNLYIATGKLQYESHLQTCDKVTVYTTCLVSPFVRISSYYSKFYTREKDIHLGQFAEKPTFFFTRSQ